MTLSRSTYPKTHDSIEIMAIVEIVEHGSSDAVARVIGPDADEWRAMYPDIKTEQDVLDHWAMNAVVNGLVDVCQIDGWADLPAETVTLHIDRVETF